MSKTEIWPDGRLLAFVRLTELAPRDAEIDQTTFRFLRKQLELREQRDNAEVDQIRQRLSERKHSEVSS